MNSPPLAVEFIVDRQIQPSGVLPGQRAPARAQKCFDGSLNLSIDDEFNSKWGEIHRITNQMLEFKRFEKEIKEINTVYIYCSGLNSVFLCGLYIFVRTSIVIFVIRRIFVKF